MKRRRKQGLWGTRVSSYNQGWLRKTNERKNFGNSGKAIGKQKKGKNITVLLHEDSTRRASTCYLGRSSKEEKNTVQTKEESVGGRGEKYAVQGRRT